MIVAGLFLLLGPAYARATESKAATGIVISEVYYYGEWVELLNRGPAAVDLTGWHLHVYGAPAPIVLTGSIAADQYLVVNITVGLSDTGDYLELRDPSDFTVDAVSYGGNTSLCRGLVAAPGESLQLYPLWAEPGSCAYTSGVPSPDGAPPVPTATPVPTPTIAAGQLLLTEVFYQGACRDEWVEIVNRSTAVVPLAGLQLSDGVSAQALDGVLAPGEVLVVRGLEGAVTPGCGAALWSAPEACMAIRLADDGDSVALVDGVRELDRVEYGPMPAVPLAPSGQSLARLLLPDGTLGPWSASMPGPGCLQQAPSPTATVTVTATPTITPTATATVSVGSVALTEVYYQGDCVKEWVEIANLTSREIALDGWRLGDNTTTTALQLTLAPGSVAVVLPAGSQLVAGCGAQVHFVTSACLGNGLADLADRVSLQDGAGTEHDLMEYGGAGTPGIVPLAPPGHSLARHLSGSALAPWSASTPAPGCLQAAPTAPAEPSATPTLPSGPGTATPDPTLPQAVRSLYLPIASSNAASPVVASLLISEVLYQGATANQGDEFVEIRNTTAGPIDLEGYKVGDAEYAGDGEGMYAFPPGAIPAGQTIVVARCAADFAARFGRLPDYEFVLGACPDFPECPNMRRYSSWGRGTFSLADSGDEVLLLGPADEIVDTAAFGSGQYRLVGLEGSATAPLPLSIHRVGLLDRDDMSLDFGREGPSPGLALEAPESPLPASGPSWNGLHLYWGDLHAHSSYSDGAGPPELAFARARQAGLHFYAITDHGYMLRDVEWEGLRSAANDSTVPGRFLALAGFEWTHPTEGHLNVYGTKDRTSREQTETLDPGSLLVWLAARPQALSQVNHPGVGGTYVSRRPADANYRTVALQEVRNQSGSDARLHEQELLTAWRNGWMVAPTAGSDVHDWLWGSGSAIRTGVWAPSLAEDSVLAALAARRAFASEDSDLAVAWTCGDAWMGSGGGVPSDSCRAFYADGQGEAATLELLDFNGVALGQWTATSGHESLFTAPASPFWLRATQDDGDRAWTPPIWMGQ